MKTSSPKITVAVVGLGYVGLPLALAFGRTNLKTIGFDVKEKRVEELKKGIDSTDELSRKEVKNSKLVYSCDNNTLKEANFFIVAVPTPVDDKNDPDMSLVIMASETVGRYLKKGDIVVYESTVYPGATEEDCVPVLERVSGLKWKKDFNVGYSPERINPGDKEHTLEKVVKIVSGDTPESTKIIATTYKKVCKAGVHVAPNIKTAEAAKVIENTQRDINIALMNELSLIFHKMNINTSDVLAAAGTKWNFLKFTPGLVGGHCFSGKQRLTLINGHKHKSKTLADYWQELKNKKDVKISEIGATTLIEPLKTIKTLSFDKENGRAVFSPIKAFSLRRNDTGFRITTAGNHSIEVSSKHPMIIDENGEWFVKFAENINIGEQIPLLQDLPHRENLRADIDLIAEMPKEWHKRYRVKRKEGTWKELKDQLQIKKNTGKKASNFYYLDYLPLEVFLALEKKKAMPIKRDEVVLASGRGHGSFQTFPAIIKLDEYFARLVGYYLSEGCITHDKGTRVRFTFHNQETDTIADCRHLLKEMGIRRHSVFQDAFCHSTHIKASSELFGFLLEKILQCGVRSEDAHIPDEILYGNDKLRWNVLTGLLRGDGGVSWKYNHLPYKKNGKVFKHARNLGAINFFSSSPELFHETQLILMSFGIPFYLDKKRPLLTIQGAKNMEKFSTFFLDYKKTKLDSYFANKQKSPVSRYYKSYGGYLTAPVKKIEKIELPELYSVEVENTHTVVSDGGLITHNCIGVDPYYLVHKAKQLGYESQVITAGRKINDYMPEYVAQLTIDGLKEAGKQIKGAKILVMGLTFKENVKDFRNSKILVTINILKKLGANVIGFDPLLDSETIKNEFGIESVDKVNGTFDVIIIATPHKKFINMQIQISKFATNKLVVIDIKSLYPELKNQQYLIYSNF